MAKPLKLKNKFKIAVLILLFMVSGMCVYCGLAQAQESFSEESNFTEEYFEARVVNVLEEKRIEENGRELILQELEIEGLTGDWRGQKVTAQEVEIDSKTENPFENGDRVLASQVKDIAGNESFFVNDFVRRDKLYLLAAFFIVVILIAARWRGLRALIGLILSFLIILKFIIPQILAGKDPLLVSLFFSAIIIVVSVYLVYGLNKKSTIAIAGTFCGLVFVGILSIMFTEAARLTGFAQEETIFLMRLTEGMLNLKGLLLAGFIIGALGVLDDITISQVSTVEQLHKANPNLPKKEIYKRAMKVGVDHIASMVNTLFLAYTGASLPLLLLFTFKEPPFTTFGQVINHEIIATEIIRTLVGSIGLALAVPATTFLAAYFYAKTRDKKNKALP